MTQEPTNRNGQNNSVLHDGALVLPPSCNTVSVTRFHGSAVRLEPDPIKIKFKNKKGTRNILT